ncbi:MAG TPA: patatin-like phospholipase family protein [Solirubrobacteraceae bacterium]|jgi:NTE family protein|nr:patatin-like phospholipase family protein [Solirubrobacteraceae bacterium]
MSVNSKKQPQARPSSRTLAAARARGSARPRTAFVLSGGASLGAIQVGMLHALYESGVIPDLLVGTSAGALNAAFIASRPQTIRTSRELGRIWCDLEREDIFPVSMGALVGGLCGRRDHLIPDRGLRTLVRRHVQFGDLADAAIPVHVVAFDLNEGCEVLLSEGPAVDAIVAAASIPGLFPPVRIGGRRLVDGGVVNNTPISHAVALGAERIYVLPTQDPARPLAHVSIGALDAGIHALSLLIDRQLEADLERFSRVAELIVLPARNATSVQPASFEHASRLIGETLAAARDHLAPRSPAVPLRMAA